MCQRLQKNVFGLMTFPSHQSGWQHPKDAHHEWCETWTRRCKIWTPDFCVWAAGWLKQICLGDKLFCCFQSHFPTVGSFQTLLYWIHSWRTIFWKFECYVMKGRAIMLWVFLPYPMRDPSRRVLREFGTSPTVKGNRTIKESRSGQRNWVDNCCFC